MQSQSPSTPASQPSSTTANAEHIGEKILEEASPASLEELMNRAPQITDAEADRIIDYLRAQREKFAAQEAAPKPKKAPRQKGPILSADELLKDIDLNF
jgi:hypothetical protein